MSWTKNIVLCDSLFYRQEQATSSDELFAAIEQYGNLFLVSRIRLNGLSVGKTDQSFLLSENDLLAQFHPSSETIQSYQKRMRQSI